MIPSCIAENLARLYCAYEQYAPIYKKEHNKELTMIGFLMLPFSK